METKIYDDGVVQLYCGSIPRMNHRNASGLVLCMGPKKEDHSGICQKSAIAAFLDGP